MLSKGGKRKLSDYVIEFIIVLLGITIAFWLSNLGERKKESRLERVYLQQLHEDLNEDIDSFEQLLDFNEQKNQLLGRGIAYVQSKPRLISADTIAKYALRLGSYNFFYPNDNSYLTLQQSGDLKVIKNQEFKQKLVSLYKAYALIKTEQDNLIQALDDNFFPPLYSSYNMITGEITNPEYFRTAQCLNFIGFTVTQTNQLSNLYRQSRRIAEETIDLLELETGTLKSIQSSSN